MALRIYNTLKRKKEIFEPQSPGKVSMYVCGPTVYDSCHIGHARAVVVFDVIARYFKKSGLDVTYVRNFTDVDDKIINRANELGVDFQSVSERYIEEFYQDMDALGVARATFEPRATEHIGGIIKVIETLIEKGNAYPVEGDVYFAVASHEGYGKLSGRKLEDMEAGARVDVDDRKNNPFDFALWKAAKPGEPYWDSPWGKGRPGWHIECSAMSGELLGETFDIHGGGKDLIFPHHENEIAQSEAASGREFARYWIHNGFVNIDSEKMSKSLGNFTMIKDVIKQYNPEAIRLFLLSNHYRSPIDFTDRSMDEATAGLDRIYAVLLRVAEICGEAAAGKTVRSPFWDQYVAAMDDDFNTAKGIGVLFEAVRGVNRLLDESKEKPTEETAAQLLRTAKDIVEMGGILGFLNVSPESYFETRKAATLTENAIDAAAIEGLIQERADARKAKDFKRADEVRDELAAMNILIEDRPDGKTIWKVA